MNAGGNARCKGHSADPAISRVVAHNFRLPRTGVFHAFRFQSHTALWASSVFALADFRVHRANVGYSSLPVFLLLHSLYGEFLWCDPPDLHHLAFRSLGGERL